MVSSLSVRQVLSDYETLKSQVRQGNDAAKTHLGEVKIDTFFSRVDDDPQTRDKVIATHTAGNFMDVVSYDQYLDSGAQRLSFQFARVDLTQPGTPPQSRTAVIDVALATLQSSSGNASLNITA